MAVIRKKYKHVFPLTFQSELNFPYHFLIDGSISIFPCDFMQLLQKYSLTILYRFLKYIQKQVRRKHSVTIKSTIGGSKQQQTKQHTTKKVSTASCDEVLKLEFYDGSLKFLTCPCVAAPNEPGTAAPILHNQSRSDSGKGGHSLFVKRTMAGGSAFLCQE